MPVPQLTLFPNDLLLVLADFLPDASLSALARTSRRFFAALDHALYARDARHNNSFALRWAVEAGITSVVAKALAAGGDPLARRQFKMRPEDPYKRKNERLSFGPILSVAAETGRLEIASLLIAAGAPVDIPITKHQQPPVLAAVKGDQLDMVKLLLERGNVSLDAIVKSRGANLLALAAKYAGVELFRYMLDTMSNPNLNAVLSESPFVIAVKTGRIDLMPLFLGSDKVNVAYADHRGRTALMCATMKTPPTDVSEAIFQLLLESGKFDPNLADNDGKVALTMACEAGSTNNMRRLLAREDIDPNVANNEGLAPVFYCLRDLSLARIMLESDKVIVPVDDVFRAACENGWTDVAKALVKKNAAAASGTNGAGETWLHAASANGQTEIVKLLVKYGTVSIDQPTIDGKTALHCALDERYEAAANALIHAGANVNILDRKSWSGLCYASQGSSHKLVETILKKGGDVRAVAENDDTPLHIAARHGQAKVARVLLAHGADPSARNGENKTPLHLIRGGRAEMFAMLMEHGADPSAADDAGSTPLHILCQDEPGPDSVGVAGALLDRGAAVDAAMPDGTTPLHTACAHHSRQLAALLLARGADPLAECLEGRTGRRITPFHLESRPISGTGVLALLFAHADGAAVTDLWHAGWTPLHEAASSLNGAAARLLLDHGADPNAAEENGRTPLHQVFEHPRLEHVMSQEGAATLLRVLLAAKGIDVNRRDGAGRTPLRAAVGCPDGLRAILRDAGGVE